MHIIYHLIIRSQVNIIYRVMYQIILVCSPSFVLVAEFYGHQNCTYYVKTCLSPDGRYIASGSSDELAYIWRTNKPGAPVVQLSGHTEEVTCIAWCGVGETKVLIKTLNFSSGANDLSCLYCAHFAYYVFKCCR